MMNEPWQKFRYLVQKRQQRPVVLLVSVSSIFIHSYYIFCFLFNYNHATFHHTEQWTHLKYRDVILPVDLVGRRMEPVALLHVLVEYAATLHVAQAELAQVELG